MLDKVTRLIKEFAEISPINKLVTGSLALTVILMLALASERKQNLATQRQHLDTVIQTLGACREDYRLLQEDYRSYLKHEKEVKLNYGKD